MRKLAVIRHYGSAVNVARVLDISRAAVSKWGAVVPLESATALEMLSAGAVRVERSMYPALARAAQRAAEVHP